VGAFPEFMKWTKDNDMDLYMLTNKHMIKNNNVKNKKKGLKEVNEE